MRKPLKVHLYPDCRNRIDGPVTHNLEFVTCGQCKGTILEFLREQTWVGLPDFVLKALDWAQGKRENPQWSVVPSKLGSP